jgi:hypothetical protein
MVSTAFEAISGFTEQVMFRALRRVQKKRKLDQFSVKG